MKKRNRSKKIFTPSTIVATIAQALDRDLRVPTQVYGDKQRATVMLMDRQREEFTKKFSDPLNNENDLETVTFIKFLLVNQHMRDFGEVELDLPTSDMLRPQSRYSKRHNILLRARALMHSVLTPFVDEEWFYHCKHSGGSSLGVPYSDTSLEAKSSFPITLTSGARHIFDDYLSHDAMLRDALLRFNKANPVSGRYLIVEGSRATTVPKSDSIRRMIAIEPTGNMFLQQGLMEMMYDRMRRVALDVELLPERHRRRAKRASITSEEATIDFSSASDCVAIELLRWLIPPKWFDCLNAVRSPYIIIDGEKCELNMFSTMGNAGTFPLETLVFWTLGHACRLQELRTLSSFPEWKDLKKVSVFGDDCIVPAYMAADFMSVCESVGFIVNKEKSFIDGGGFRESCGGDYLRGFDVRPYCVKAPTSVSINNVEPWLYIIFNSLYAKYKLCFGELMCMADMALWRCMIDLFGQYDISVKLVPDHFPDDSGLKMSQDIDRLDLYYPGLKLSKIGKSANNRYDFLFMRYNYRQTKRRFDYLHYAVWLKRPGGERSPWWIQRKRGGYVVARGQTSFWSIPVLLDRNPV